MRMRLRGAVLLTIPSTTPDSKQLTSQAPERSAWRQSEGDLDLLFVHTTSASSSHLQGAGVLLKGNFSQHWTLLLCQPEGRAGLLGHRRWHWGLPSRQLASSDL